MKKVKRGEIYLADLSDAQGSEQGFVRPVLILQNNAGNKHSPTTIVACLTSKIESKAHLPTHYILPGGNGLKYRSMVMCEKIREIDKGRLQKKICRLSEFQMCAINQKVKIALGLNRFRRHK